MTVGGATHALDQPFIVLATQNPIEMEGTYPLPEAQLERFFFKLALSYPSAAEISSVMISTHHRSGRRAGKDRGCRRHPPLESARP